MPPPRLDNLPFDVFYQIATSLDDRDCIHLSRTNRIIHDSMQSELIARKTVENVLRHSKEGSIALQAQAGYRKAVSHRFDINEAVATATPYSVSVLAYGSDFLYQQGVLCYRVGQEVRLLDVHRVAQRERVLNLHDVLRRLESSPMDRDAAERVKLIHYHDGIVVLRVINDDALGDALLAIDMESRPGLSRRRRLLLHAVVPSDVPIFVRNSRSYLWYGCFTASAANSDGIWSVCGVDFATLDTIEFPLDRVVDGDLGQTLCFEMYKEHLYAVSTQVASNDDERFSSFYHWFCHAPRQKGQKWNDRVWRREHREGPINEMWTDLSIRTDEETGNPVIIECRREWRHGKSENHRTTYIQPLPTPEEAAEADLRRSPWVNDNEDEDENETESDNLKNISDHDTHGQTFDQRPEKRLRRNYHAEYEHTHDQNNRQEFIAARTKYRSYHLSAATFIDLVNDPAPEADGLRSRDRIRLRTVSRKRKCPIDEEGTGLLFKHTQTEADGRPVEGSEEQFSCRGVRLWPAEDSPSELTHLLCPDTRAGSVHAISDERSLLYSISSPGLPLGNKALILISFDPKIRFPNLPTLRSLKTPVVGDIFPVDIPAPGRASSGSLIREAKPLYQAIGRGYWLR